MDFAVFYDNNNKPRRRLQQIPDYTSPPLEDALQATPPSFRSDEVIEEMRDLDANGNCTVSAAFSNTSNNNYCHIPFVVSDKPSSSLGVILYGGGLVDPRSYAVLAERLANDYGLLVVIPVFANDLAFSFTGSCNSGRLALAQAAFPDIEKWLFVGHSFGGVAAATDVWIESMLGTDFAQIAGLVLLAADIQPFTCGSEFFIDYSDTDLPMALVTATEDGLLNFTRWELNRVYASSNATTFVSIVGGNHGYFADYNDTLRTPLLGQVDGTPNITKYEQWELTVQAIMEVAQRSGVELPNATIDTTSEAPITTTATPATKSPTSSPWMTMSPTMGTFMSMSPTTGAPESSPPSATPTNNCVAMALLVLTIFSSWRSMFR